jgi:sigma-B regulation protein RsbU (phosphoserine phosphatase)
MPPSDGLREWLPEFGRAEKLCLASMAGVVAGNWLNAPLPLQLGILLLATVVFCWVLVRYVHRQMRRFIWRLRNRMIVAFVFSALIPLALVLLLAAYGAREISGQVAVYLVHSEMERRIGSLRSVASRLAEIEEPALQAATLRLGGFYSERFPGLTIRAESAGRVYAFPAGADPPRSSVAKSAGGLIVRDGLLHGWAHVESPGRRVTIVVPLTREFFNELQPDLGEVSVLHFPDPGAGSPVRRRPIRFAPLATQHAEEEAVQAVPPAVNRFDFELLWGTKIPIHFWEEPDRPDSALLGVHSRLSAVSRIVFSQKVESGVLPLLLGLATVILIVELISLMIGISITRTVTEAVSELYEGTLRVMKGDFSHRIHVRGNEQIAELSRSFNRMTENVERLLEVSKENERIKAELEIAREVQKQLFPTQTPSLPGLQLQAVCHAARSVSGDYYDYQMLGPDRVAMALGDVAGKGISAALLMASLQSHLRTQLRDWRDGMSTAGLVANLNQQLYLNTTPEKYATFFFAVYDGKSSRLTYTNAGHLPPVLIRGGETKLLGPTGTVVGAFPMIRYEEESVILEPGDTLVCYTDGVTEPENEFEEMFGEQRLIETLQRNIHLDAAGLISAMEEAVLAFTGSPELQDDVTMLIARRVGP